MNNFNHIIINKNRGWRGLAEAIIRDEKNDVQMRMIFSFSQLIWDDLISDHVLVMQDNKYYYVLKLKDDDYKLPKPSQQRSVLIKNAILDIKEVYKIEKDSWQSAKALEWYYITHFIKNNNNHTTSDWNCIGIRVTPEI